MKKGQIGVDDVWRDSHLVNSIRLVDRWEGPFLTLSSQKRPTLSRTRRGDVEKEETVDEAVKLVLSLLTLVVFLLKSNQPPHNISPFFSPFRLSLRSSSYALADLLILLFRPQRPHTSDVEQRHFNVS